MGPYASLIGMAVGKAVGDKLDKMDAKRNSRNRKIKFFLDKMKAEGEQQDSFAKLVKDLFVNKMALPLKKIMVAVGGFLLVLVLLIAVTVLPVVAVIAILYNSPFAFFLPPLESGDTVTMVTSAYVSEFNRDINTLANEHTGYDTGQIVYVDFEGESAGIATHIYYERQGKKVDDFSDAEADNYIELNGIKSELVIVEAEV